MRAILEIDNKEYILELTRQILLDNRALIDNMENSKIDDIVLVCLLKNHSYLKENKEEYRDIFSKIEDTYNMKELMEFITELIKDALPKGYLDGDSLKKLKIER